MHSCLRCLRCLRLLHSESELESEQLLLRLELHLHESDEAMLILPHSDVLPHSLPSLRLEKLSMQESLEESDEQSELVEHWSEQSELELDRFFEQCLRRGI